MSRMIGSEKSRGVIAEVHRQPGKHRRGLSRRDFLKLAAASALAGCSPAQVAISSPTSASTAVPSAVPTEMPTDAETPAPTSEPTDAPEVVEAVVTPPATELSATSVPAEPTHAPTAEPSRASSPVPTPAPSRTSIPTPTAQPTLAPTLEPTVVPAQAVADIQGAGLSRVVRTFLSGAAAPDPRTLDPEAIRKMLDASITKLTGVRDPLDAWRSLFAPGERIAIKVNTISGSSFWTHASLVLAVAETLERIGVPAEQIVIFDRRSRELRGAGYTLNEDGPGVRCYGTEGRYTEGWKIMDTDVKLSDVLLACDALINMPLLKQHSIAGISFALKNHYGSFDKPDRFHGARVTQGVSELNALAPIMERTRLIIGDALAVCTRNWYSAVAADTLLMSFDPVAVDTVGLQMFRELAQADGGNPAGAERRSKGWLENAELLGVGTNDPNGIDLQEVDLT